MAKKTVSLNLTWPCVIACALLALGKWVFGYSWWAVFIPFYLVAGLMVFFFLFFVAIWASGARIKFTDRQGNVRYYRHFTRVQ